MSIPLVPELLRSHMKKLAAADARIDGRGRFEPRETTLETGILGNAEDLRGCRWGTRSSSPESSSSS